MTTLSDTDLGGLARLEVVSALRGTEQRIADLRDRVRADRAGAGCARGGRVGVADRVGRAAAAAAAARGDRVDRRRRGPRPARARTTSGPAELRSLARSFNAMLARLGRSAERPRARAGGDAALRRRRGPRAAHAADDACRRRCRRCGAIRTWTPRGAASCSTTRWSEQRRLVDLLDGLQALARGDAGPIEHADGRPGRARRRGRDGRGVAPSRRRGRRPSCPTTPVVRRRLGARAAAGRREPREQRGAPRRPAARCA